MAHLRGAARTAFVLVLAALAACDKSSLTTARKLASADPVLHTALDPNPNGFHPLEDAFVSRSWGSADWPALQSSLGASAAEPVSFRVGGDDALSVRLTLEGAAPAAASIADGHLVYREALVGTDLFATSAPSRLELLFLVHDARAPSRFAWRLKLGGGLKRVKVNAQGGLDFLDQDGVARLSTPPARAVDAVGKAHPVTLRVEQDRLVASLDAAGVHYPLLVDPSFEVGVWRQVTPTNAPPGRFNTSMVFDSSRGKVVLFGGWPESGGSADDTTWEWDGTNWTGPLSPVPRPLPRSDYAFAYDESRHVAVLFGGRNFGASAFYNDLWEWNGATWTDRTPSTLPTNWPAKRYGARMVYDSARSVFVLYGGLNTNQSFADTWELDPTGPTWTNPTPTALPGLRAQHLMVYLTPSGATTGSTILFGGTSDGGSYPTDTWSWNGATWSLVNASGPSGRYGMAAAVDTLRKKLIAFGGFTGASPYYSGETWEFDGTAWARTSVTGPSSRDNSAMAYDALHKQAVLFSGYPGGVPDTWTYYARGGSCSTAADCDTPYCVDGVCCDVSSCSGLCKSCANSKNPGTCDFADPGVPDPDSSCSGTQACDGAGNCRLANGQPCTQGTFCGSGVCVDGTCCNTSCATGTTACLTCNGAGTKGTCTPITNMDDTEGPVTCAVTGTCSAAGKCILVNGQKCDGGTDCQSGNCVDQTCCSTSACTGTCMSCGQSGGAGTCGPVKNAPDPDTCAGGQTCDADGGCKFANGQFCSDGTVCASGNCVDNVCCGQAACGQCQSCAVTGKLGTCNTLTNTSDPDSCPAPSVCISDGGCRIGNGQTCGGADGGFPGIDPSCASGYCSDGVCCFSYCNGPCTNCNLGQDAGQCLPVQNAPNPGHCDGTCNASNTCLHPNGAGCSQGTQCQSGVCVDGVCCDRACNGVCESCAVDAGLGAGLGTCRSVAGINDAPACTSPLTVCAPNDAGCLIRSGYPCDGGTMCASGACVDGVCCNQSSCGQCQACASVTGNCTALVPGSVDPDSCGAGYACSADGGCLAQNGTACTDGGSAICASGVCVDGVCCATACTGACQRCDTSPGNCTTVTSGSAPRCNGTCGAGGLCQQPVGASCSGNGECAQGNCVDNVCCATACNGVCQSCNQDGGVGTCQTVTAGPDGPLCAGAGQSCSAQGACQSGPGAFCTDGGQCTTGICFGNTCCSAQCGTCQRCSATGTTCEAYGPGEDLLTGCTGDHTCTQDGRCLLKAGQTCGGNTECSTGFCGDGLCCPSTCDFPCRQCLGDGGCGLVTNGTDPECPGTCNAAGECVLEDGGHFVPDAGHDAGSGADGGAGAGGRDLFACGCSSGPGFASLALILLLALGRRRHA